MVAIAGREIPTGDAVLIGTGAAMLITIFLPWYRVSGGGVSVSYNAFDAGFFAWLPALLVVAVGALVAARVFANVQLPSAPQAGPAVILLGLSGLAAVLLVLKVLVDGNVGPFGVLDRSLAVFLAPVLAAAQAVFAFQAFKASGEALPDLGSRGGTPPAPPA